MRISIGDAALCDDSLHPWRGSWYPDSVHQCEKAPSDHGIGRGYRHILSLDISVGLEFSILRTGVLNPLRKTPYHWLHIRLFLEYFPCLIVKPGLASSIAAKGHDILLRENQRTLSHSLWTSFSASCLQFIRLSIHPSRVGIEPGSVAGDRRWGSGDFPMSTSILDSIMCIVAGCWP